MMTGRIVFAGDNRWWLVVAGAEEAFIVGLVGLATSEKDTSRD